MCTAEENQKVGEKKIKWGNNDKFRHCGIEVNEDIRIIKTQQVRV